MDSIAVGVREFHTFLLTLTRVSGVVAVAPLLGNRAVPAAAKAGFALLFALALTPLALPHAAPLPGHPWQLVGQMATDLIFGLALGYLARLLFAAVEMAGYLIDTQMGFGFINLLDPFSEQQSSVLGAFQLQLALTLYLLMNGHLLLIGAVAESFTAVPPGSFALRPAFGTAILPLLTTTFGLAMRLALPACGVLFIMDVAFGLIARLVPQINVFIVGIPAKILVGLMTVTWLLPVTAIVVGQLVAGAQGGLSTLIESGR